jgi:hypothetical protein
MGAFILYIMKKILKIMLLILTMVSIMLTLSMTENSTIAGILSILAIDAVLLILSHKYLSWKEITGWMS